MKESVPERLDPSLGHQTNLVWPKPQNLMVPINSAAEIDYECESHSVDMVPY